MREPLSKRWIAYALAAGAGMLGVSRPARAGIVYTPADIYFTSGSVFIDLNHDQTNDFKFFLAGPFGAVSQKLTVNGNLNLGAGVAGRGQNASALASGAIIGPHAPFLNVKSKSALMAQVFANSSTETVFRGKWGNAGDKYLGLRFDINGQAHYGWAEFKVVGFVDIFGEAYMESTLLGYAYDTVANQALKAGETAAPAATPEPAMLGLLALGSLGLAAWRRRKPGTLK